MLTTDLPKILHNFINRESFSNSDKLTLFIELQSAKIETTFKENNLSLIIFRFDELVFYTFSACFRDRVPVLSLIDNKPFTVFAFIIFSSIETSPTDSPTIDSETLFILAKAAATMGSKIYHYFQLNLYF